MSAGGGDPRSDAVDDRGLAAGVVVVGPGRSGTSAIARALVGAGYFAGEEGDLLGPAPSNPLGHYEPISALRTNEELLEQLGCAWWADMPVPEAQLSLRTEATPRLEAIVEQLIAAALGAPIVLKEPRINALLPLWQPVLDRWMHPVLAVRDPLEVAASHTRLDGASICHALAAWEAQMTAVLRWLAGRVATVVPYAQLTEAPELAEVLVRSAGSHLEPERSARVRAEEAVEALEPAMRHRPDAGLAQADYLTVRQAELWEYLKTLGVGDATLRLPAQLRTPSTAAHAAMSKESERVRLRDEHAALIDEHAALSDEFHELKKRTGALEQRFVDATDLAHQAIAAAERRADEARLAVGEAEARRVSEVTAMEGSVSWRLTAPLRRLKDLVRRTA